MSATLTQLNQTQFTRRAELTAGRILWASLGRITSRAGRCSLPVFTRQISPSASQFCRDKMIARMSSAVKKSISPDFTGICAASAKTHQHGISAAKHALA
jgi:hypothetical protein